MHVYEVIVGVALERPPKVDELRKVLVVANSAVEAELIAQQIAACTSVMPVCSRLIGSSAGPPEKSGAGYPPHTPTVQGPIS